MITLAATGLTAQTQTRDTQGERPAAGTGDRWNGRRPNPASGPIRDRDARVANEHQETTTDDAGGFRWTTVSRHVLVVRVEGRVLDATYGQTRPDRIVRHADPPADGQRLERLKLPVSRGG
jgi:hypothetical protein